MEIIKRRILLEDATDRNNNSPTYGTITATSFYINVLLTQNIDDMGMFTDTDYIPNPKMNPKPIDFNVRLTGKSESDYYTTSITRITGLTQSNLEDVRAYSNKKPYKVNFDVNSETYVDYTGNTINGVNRVTSLLQPITYVFDADKNDYNIGTTLQKNGLLYQDYTGNGITVVSYFNQGFNQTNTSLSALTKEEYLFGITSTPEVKNDVFIDRGMTTIFERHLKLSEVTSLGELTRYGKDYFNVTKQ